MNLLRTAGIAFLGAALAFGTFFNKCRWDSYDAEKTAQYTFTLSRYNRLLAEKEKLIERLNDLAEREKNLHEREHCLNAFDHNPFNLDDLCTVDFSTKYLTVDVAVPNDPFVRVFYNKDNVDDILHLVADAYRGIGIEIEFNIVETLDTTLLEPGKRLGVQIMHPLDFSAEHNRKYNIFETEVKAGLVKTGEGRIEESIVLINIHPIRERNILDDHITLLELPVISQEEAVTGLGWSYSPQHPVEYDYIAEILQYENFNLLLYQLQLHFDSDTINLTSPFEHSAL